MRVGIYIPGTEAEGGGAHTVERELLAALEGLAQRQAHEFLVLGHATDAPTTLPYLQLPNSTLRRTRLRAAGPYRALTRQVLGRVPGDDLLDPWTGLLRDQGLEFMLYPSPASLQLLSLEIPFLQVVWDLQHRLAPFFPDFATEGRWQERERFYASTLPRAAFAVIGTQRGAQDLGRFYGVPEERVQVLRLPTPADALDCAEHCPSDEETLAGLALPAEPFLLYPAMFWAHKNHVGLLHALRLLRDRHGLDLPLVLTGSDRGNLDHVIAVAGQLGVQDRLHLLGQVSRAQLLALYTRALALVYPALTDPDNLPPLEAMALGCPVIAADLPGTEEQLGDAALRVPPTDDAAWAEAIASLHDDPELRATLALRGNERARGWTASDYVRGLLELVDAFAPYRRCWPSGS